MLTEQLKNLYLTVHLFSTHPLEEGVLHEI